MYLMEGACKNWPPVEFILQTNSRQRITNSNYMLVSSVIRADVGLSFLGVVVLFPCHYIVR